MLCEMELGKKYLKKELENKLVTEVVITRLCNTFFNNYSRFLYSRLIIYYFKLFLKFDSFKKVRKLKKF